MAHLDSPIKKLIHGEGRIEPVKPNPFMPAMLATLTEAQLCRLLPLQATHVTGSSLEYRWLVF